MSETRRAFLAAHAAGVPFEWLLGAFEIKKSAAYELLRRAREMPIDEAVAVKSRAPRVRANALNDEVVGRIVELKQAFPKWGPKKLIRPYAERFHERPPSAASISNILKARGLTRTNQRRMPRVPQRPLTSATQPNDVWATDHKGMMRALNVEPLTVVDLHSRCWLECRPFTDKSYRDTREAFETLFEKMGTPLVMRVDAGQPWTAVTAPHRLTKLSAWWVALGIRVEIVNSPQQNGCVERLHGTMQRDMNDAVDDVRNHFEKNRRLYNEMRPHEGIGMATPASLYVRSPRRPLERVFDHATIGCDESRSVQSDGTISWRGAYPPISKSLAGRRVGLRRRSMTTWSVHYYELELGKLAPDGFTPNYA